MQSDLINNVRPTTRIKHFLLSAILRVRKESYVGENPSTSDLLKQSSHET